MYFFTTTITFSDHTEAIEQFKAPGPKEALSKALDKAEALSKIDKKIINELIKNKLRLVHLADMRGVWIWHHIYTECDPLDDILGGVIVQTDINAPKRPTNE